MIPLSQHSTEDVQPAAHLRDFEAVGGVVVTEEHVQDVGTLGALVRLRRDAAADEVRVGVMAHSQRLVDRKNVVYGGWG